MKIKHKNNRGNNSNKEKNNKTNVYKFIQFIEKTLDSTHVILPNHISISKIVKRENQNKNKCQSQLLWEKRKKIKEKKTQRSRHVKMKIDFNVRKQRIACVYTHSKRAPNDLDGSNL